MINAHRLVDIVKYELALLFTKESWTPL